MQKESIWRKYSDSYVLEGSALNRMLTLGPYRIS
jgi:hypothetical protein